MLSVSEAGEGEGHHNGTSTSPHETPTAPEVAPSNREQHGGTASPEHWAPSTVKAEVGTSDWHQRRAPSNAPGSTGSDLTRATSAGESYVMKGTRVSYLRAKDASGGAMCSMSSVAPSLRRIEVLSPFNFNVAKECPPHITTTTSLETPVRRFRRETIREIPSFARQLSLENRQPTTIGK